MIGGDLLVFDEDYIEAILTHLTTIQASIPKASTLPSRKYIFVTNRGNFTVKELDTLSHRLAANMFALEDLLKKPLIIYDLLGVATCFTIRGNCPLTSSNIERWISLDEGQETVSELVNLAVGGLKGQQDTADGFEDQQDTDDGLEDQQETDDDKQETVDRQKRESEERDREIDIDELARLHCINPYAHMTVDDLVMMAHQLQMVEREERDLSGFKLCFRHEGNSSMTCTHPFGRTRWEKRAAAAKNPRANMCVTRFVNDDLTCTCYDGHGKLMLPNISNVVSRKKRNYEEEERTKLQEKQRAEIYMGKLCPFPFCIQMGIKRSRRDIEENERVRQLERQRDENVKVMKGIMYTLCPFCIIADFIHREVSRGRREIRKNSMQVETGSGVVAYSRKRRDGGLEKHRPSITDLIIKVNKTRSFQNLTKEDIEILQHQTNLATEVKNKFEEDNRRNHAIDQTLTYVLCPFCAIVDLIDHEVRRGRRDAEEVASLDANLGEKGKQDVDDVRQRRGVLDYVINKSRNESEVDCKKMYETLEHPDYAMFKNSTSTLET